MNYITLSNQFLNKNISGRYITNDHIKPIILNLDNRFKVKVEGKSVLKNDIYSVRFGTGKTKIFIWSQMHGNESTCTKALMDLFTLLSDKNETTQFIYSNFDLYIIPILNPDGAILYTRENANKVDLNRDAKNNSQPESKLLHRLFEEFMPDYCFNMHDQRTIYGVGNTGKSAAVAFLSPSYNMEREINEHRTKAMNVIAAINNTLQDVIPGYVARFDDGFNENCFGEYFTMQNVPTVLFEGGHYPNDYQRDVVRKFIFIAMISAFYYINENDIVDDNIDNYFDIPQNNSCFYDILYKNAKIIENGKVKIINFATQYDEVVKDGDIVFNAKLQTIENNDINYYGHVEYDLNEETFFSNYCEIPQNEAKPDFFIGKNKEFVEGMLKK